MKLNKAWLVRLLYFLVFCCTASWLPVLADFCKSRGLTGTETSLVLSIPPVMMFLVQPLYGMVADRVGYRKVLILSSFCAGISFCGYLVNGGLAWLLLVTLAMAVFYNTIQPILDSIALKLVDEDPRFSYGTLRSFGAAGWATTGIIIGYVIDGVHINAIFIVSAISLGLLGLFAFLLRVEHGGLEYVTFKGAGNLFRKRGLSWLLICVFLVSVGGTAIWNFYSLYMKENGASATLVGYALSFQGLCEIPFFYFASRIISRLGLRVTLVITALATVTRLILYSLVSDPLLAIPIELLHGISWSLFWAACVEYVGAMVDKAQLATGQSLLYAAYYGAGAVAGNYWTGFLYDGGYKLSAIFSMNAGIVALAAVMLFWKLRSHLLQT